MVVMCLNDIWFSKQLWRNNCNKIWLNRIIRFWYDFIRCHASGRFFWWFQFQLIQSLICWIPLRLAQNWSRTLALIEKNFKKEASNISIHSNDAMCRNSSLNERTEKAPATQRTEKASAKERAGKGPAKERTEKAPAKERKEKALTKECTERAPAKEATGKAFAEERTN